MAATISLLSRSPVPFMSPQEAAEHCRVTDEGEFGLLSSLVEVAVDMVEDYTGLALTANRYLWTSPVWPSDMRDRLPWYSGRPEFAGMIVLPRTPLITVEAVRYYDAASEQQTVSPTLYSVDRYSTPGMVVLHSDFTRPELPPQYRADAVSIEFTAGLDNAPARARQAVKILVSHLYDNQGAISFSNPADLPHSLKALLHSLRI